MIRLPINLSTFNHISNLTGDDYENISKEYSGLYNIDIRDMEVEGINSLIEKLNIPFNCLEGFFIGYTIPQISKEFDLIRLV